MDILENTPTISHEINSLIRLCWDNHEDADYDIILRHSLSYFTVRDSEGMLIAFCNLAWDGGRHATIFDLNVHPDHRHKGIALSLINKAGQVAIDNKIKYFHVDFNPQLEPLYKKAGFDMIAAGLMVL